MAVDDEQLVDKIIDGLDPPLNNQVLIDQIVRNMANDLAYEIDKQILKDLMK